MIMTREEELIAEYEAAENRKLSNGEKEFILNVLQWADEHPISGEQIAAMKNEIKFLKRKLVECDKMYRELQNKNPWRDAETDPPKDGKPVIGIDKYGVITQYEYSPEEKIWSMGMFISDAPEYWVPTISVEGGKK